MSASLNISSKLVFIVRSSKSRPPFLFFEYIDIHIITKQLDDGQRKKLQLKNSEFMNAC